MSGAISQLLSWPVALVPTLFWLWMIYDCVKHDPERSTWLWILIFLNFPGAVIYFLVRRAPTMNWPTPHFFRKWLHREKLWNAEAAARNIGKVHQFVILGNELYAVGEADRAHHAFEQALSKDAKNPQALWGMAQILIERQDFQGARGYLETLLQVDPEHKYGDASLAYCQTLVNLEDWEAAYPNLEADIKQWSHPESTLMLARLQIRDGQPEAARALLDRMLFNLKGSPRFHYRKKRHLANQAEKMLRSL
jgi:hypothetical protein